MRFGTRHDDEPDDLEPDELRQALVRCTEELTKRVRQLVNAERASADDAMQLAGTIMAASPSTAIALAAHANAIARLASEIAEGLMLTAQHEYGADLAQRYQLDTMSAEQHNELRQESAERGIQYEPPYAATQHLQQWPDDAMLNIREIVNFTTLSESTIDRMIERGEFPAGVKIGERRVAWRWGNVRQKVFKLVDEARRRERQQRRLRSA